MDDYVKIPETGIGDLSDGYHTFNELYHHRAILFSVICNMFPSIAWKSKYHNDGSMYDGMFIVGVDTPEGPATYHYDIDPYWDMFKIDEISFAPEWDGHTPDEAISRIGSLSNYSSQLTLRVKGKWIPVEANLDSKQSPTGQGLIITGYICSVCKRYERERHLFCHCGADMRGTENE